MRKKIITFDKTDNRKLRGGKAPGKVNFSITQRSYFNVLKTIYQIAFNNNVLP